MLMFRVLAAVLAPWVLVSQALAVDWVRAEGGTASDAGISVAVDSLGNAYTTQRDSSRRRSPLEKGQAPSI